MGIQAIESMILIILNAYVFIVRYRSSFPVSAWKCLLGALLPPELMKVAGAPIIYSQCDSLLEAKSKKPEH
jgi:hypothetical protein